MRRFRNVLGHHALQTSCVHVDVLGGHSPHSQLATGSLHGQDEPSLEQLIGADSFRQIRQLGWLATIH
jgi:hypothetical protein